MTPGIKASSEPAGLVNATAHLIHLYDAAVSGSHAINPVTGEAVPIWVADYVLGSYGSGAIMAVPAHDKRDHELAVKFGLPIKQVCTSPLSQVSNMCPWWTTRSW